MNYGLPRPQLNFVQLLSSTAVQEVTISCQHKIDLTGAVQFIGPMKRKIADEYVKVTHDNCSRVRGIDHDIHFESLSLSSYLWSEFFPLGFQDIRLSLPSTPPAYICQISLFVTSIWTLFLEQYRYLL